MIISLTCLYIYNILLYLINFFFNLNPLLTRYYISLNFFVEIKINGELERRERKFGIELED
jgi:hypothetical protein